MMAHILEEEGQQTSNTSQNESNESSETYKFPNLESWLNTLKLSHIYSALRDEGFKTLQVLVALDNDDLNELCGEIKSTLKNTNNKFSLSNKGLFKSEIIKEKEKYHQYLSTINSPNNRLGSHKSLSSMILTCTKEERQSLQKLNVFIKFYSEYVKSTTKAGKDAQSDKLTIFKSIAELSKQFQSSLTSIVEVGFEKHLKITNNAIKYGNKPLSNLMNMKEKCENALSLDNTEKLVIEESVSELIKTTKKEADDFGKCVSEAFREEFIPAVIQEIFTNVEVAKMAQHFYSFLFFVAAQLISHAMQPIDIETQKIYLIILPHAIEFIDDIKNELKQRNVKIIKECGKISNEKVTILITRSSLDDKTYLIPFDYSTNTEKAFLNKKSLKKENEEKKIEEDNKDDFEFDPVKDPIMDIQTAFYFHLDKYNERSKSEAIVFLIDVPKYDNREGTDFFSKNFDIFCPAYIGEYASIYHPQTINGKLMKMYSQKYGEENLNTTVNLGFIQCIPEKMGKEIIESHKEK